MYQRRRLRPEISKNSRRLAASKPVRALRFTRPPAADDPAKVWNNLRLNGAGCRNEMSIRTGQPEWRGEVGARLGEMNNDESSRRHVKNES